MHIKVDYCYRSFNSKAQAINLEVTSSVRYHLTNIVYSFRIVESSKTQVLHTAAKQGENSNAFVKIRFAHSAAFTKFNLSIHDLKKINQNYNQNLNITEILGMTLLVI